MGKARATSGASTAVLVVVFLVGLCLLLYPAVSNFVNDRGQAQVISSYSQVLEMVDSEKCEALWAEAEAYNQALLGRLEDAEQAEDLLSRYEEILDVSGTGIMGYVEIPNIDCKLPIYHGTDDEELQVAVGHLEWTSLPVGGPSTHSAISGHRGLPTATLLSDIDKLQLGDAFYIHVLDKVLEYRVDDIAVVLPNDTEKLRVVEGRDYVTLVTCTPYGVNSHRLLVRGVRVGEENAVVANVAMMLSNEIRPISLVFLVPVAFASLAAVVALLWGASSLLRKRGRPQVQPTGHAESSGRNRASGSGSPPRAESRGGRTRGTVNGANGAARNAERTRR